MSRSMRKAAKGCLALASFACTALAVASGYAVTDHWMLGGDGGWDYPSVDPAAHRLYLSRASHVLVVDTTTGKSVGDIGDTAGVHGIAVAADLGRGFISEGRRNAVKVFGLATLNEIASIEVGPKPDAILYDAGTHRVVAFNGGDGTASIIDGRGLAVIKALPLGGEPEFGTGDGRGHAWVDLVDKNQLAALDLESQTVTARWPLPGCEEPTGLAVDTAHGRAFATCGNAVMSIVDTTSGRVLATVPIGHGSDGAAFDPGLGNAYSPNGEGTLTIVHETDPDHFAVTETLTTERGARTIALDPATHRLYLPTAKFGAQPEGTHGRPPILPGSFEVLVVAPPGAAAR